jgi:hypothetical protein
MTRSAGSRPLWIFGFLMVVLVALTLYATLEEEQGTSELANPIVKPNTYSALPSGTKGIFKTLERAGPMPRRLLTPWTELPAGARVIICLCPLRPVADEEWDAMWSWVHEGGFVVFAPVAFSAGLDDQNWANMEALDGGDLTAGAPRLAVSTKLRSVGDKDLRGVWKQRTPLYGKPNVVASQVEWGKGGALLLTHPEIWSNEGVSRGDNLQFLLNLLASREARAGSLYFDEYHHGYGHASTTASLWRRLPAVVRLGLWQIVAAALLGGWALSRRRAAPRLVLPPPHERLEYLESMAVLLQKAQASRLVARRRAQTALARAASALGLEAGATLEQTCAALAAHDAGMARELQEVVTGLAQLSTRPTPVADEELLRLAEREARLMAALGRLT